MSVVFPGEGPCARASDEGELFSKLVFRECARSEFLIHNTKREF